MALVSPNDSAEILYGASGDVRNEINAYLNINNPGHYADENELPGSLIIRSLERSTRLINGYIEKPYSDYIPFLTVASVPKLLDDISSDIATYYTLRSMTAMIGPLSDEKKQSYYIDHTEEDNGTLNRIHSGHLQLPELTASTAEDVVTSRNETRTSVFDLDATINQKVDPDLLEDIENERD